jgi:hypothetical protein
LAATLPVIDCSIGVFPEEDEAAALMEKCYSARLAIRSSNARIMYGTVWGERRDWKAIEAADRVNGRKLRELMDEKHAMDDNEKRPLQGHPQNVISAPALRGDNS